MLFTQNHAQFFDDNGNPLSGGTVKFFEPGTSTPKDVYSDGELTTSIGSEVTLDSAGRAVIFLDGNYKITLEDSAGTVIKTVDNANVQDDPVSLVLTNPSFETAGNSATDIPGWTRSAPSGTTVERVTTDSYHGAACLEITSDGTNAGYAETTDFISISPGREYEISFALESSSATVTNTVQIRWFDEAQSLVSTNSVYNESSGNPTTFESKAFSATPPANARYAKIRAQLGSSAGTTRYDDFGLSILATNLNSTLDGEIIRNGGTTLPSILSDTFANRPATGTAGRWFYATDKSRWYRDTGAAWEVKAGHLERVEVSRVASLAVANNTLTEVPFDNEISDADDMWDSGTATDIVMPRDGVITATVLLIWEFNATGHRELLVRNTRSAATEWLDGANLVPVQPVTAPNALQLITLRDKPVNAGDVITFEIAQDSGGSLDFTGGGITLRYVE